MRRVVSLWFPTWPTDRLRQTQGGAALPVETPLVTRTHDGHRLVVSAADTAAKAKGIKAGMPLAQAQALVPALTVMESDPAGDAAALSELAAWCQRYTPLTNAAPPDGIWLDVTGSTHLFGGEAALLEDLTSRLSRSGVLVHAAIADTPGAAHALARFGGSLVTIAAPGCTRAVLDALPIAALRLPAETCDTLQLLGLETIGALAKAPRPPLARRFGNGLLRRLDQALGLAPEPLAPVPPRVSAQCRLSFAEPLLTCEALEAAIASLAGALCTKLERRGLGVQQLDLLVERVDSTLQTIRIGAACPNRNPSHLARLMRERLDAIDPGLGIEAMRLIATLTGSLPPAQKSLEREPDSQADIAPLVDRLRNRFGVHRVYRVQPVESDIPERSVRRITELSEGNPGHQPPWPAGWPRPARLLPRPQRVQALSVLPDHPPAAFEWRRVRHRIRRADGPERITGEWWLRDSELVSVRDYWTVENQEGRRFWLFRAGDGVDTETGDLSWYLHGLF